MLIARKQTLVQLNEDLLEGLDREAEARGISRSALIREAAEAHLHATSEAQAVRRWVDGYRRQPQTEEEMRWADGAVIEAIKEEPW